MTYTPTHSSLMVVMQVCLHLYFVLFKCNRVTTRVPLIFAVFSAIGLFFSHPSLSSFSLSSGLGILSGYTLGFLFGLKMSAEGIGVASLAAFLCLGLWRPDDFSLLVNCVKVLALTTCSPWWPPWRTSPRRKCSCPSRIRWAW